MRPRPYVILAPHRGLDTPYLALGIAHDNQAPWSKDLRFTAAFHAAPASEETEQDA
jgi:hypothetical protein